MNYEAFLQCILDTLEERLPEGVTCKYKRVTKNNGVELDSVMIIKEDCNISPTIYLEGFWNRYLVGRNIEDIIQDILAAYGENALAEDFDLSLFTDFEKVKNRIVYKVINYEKNMELLKGVPHYRYLDLAVVFYCLVEDMSNATILIHKSHAKLWNVSEKDLLEVAAVNTPKLLKYKFSNIFSYLSSYNFPGLPKEEAGGLVPMYVLSNNTGIYGAGCVLYKGLLHKLGEELENDFYVFPSSIHEVIVMPDIKGCDGEYFRMMVKEINANEVKEEEVLSDSVYFYSRERDNLEMLK